MRRRRRNNEGGGFTMYPSKLLTYAAWAFIILSFIYIMHLWTVTYTLRQDCNNVYSRDIKLFGYWQHIEIGSTKDGCPQSPANSLPL